MRLHRSGSFLRMLSVPVLGFMTGTSFAAQVAEPGVATLDQDQVSEANQEADIIVTGTRIRRQNFENPEPTVTLEEEYVEDRNLTNVADALNELPAFRGSTTPNAGQAVFGQGVNFVNNFGLGSNRTLTLVNGRRHVTSNAPTIFGAATPGVQVDLNVVPTILIDRVDTVSVGGAPVYGSDAISGTVNVILKRRFEGLELRATSGITEQGDNFRYSVSGAGGLSFAGGRGNIILAVSRDEVDGVLNNARDFFRDEVANLSNPSSAQAAALGRPPGTGFANDGRLNPNIGFNDGPNDGNPGSVLVRNRTDRSFTEGGLIVDGPLGGQVQFDSNGNLIPFDPGIPFLGFVSSGGDGIPGFFGSSNSQITSNLERNIVNGYATYEVAPALRFFFEGTYYNARADELADAATLNSPRFGGENGGITFRADNPFLNDQARAVLAAAGVTTFTISRASVEPADLSGFNETDLYRGVVGIDGDFEVGGRQFNYEVSANYGRTESHDFRQDVDSQRFVNAVNVRRDAAGNIVCDPNPLTPAGPGATDRPVADPSCVPLNLFGRGAPSQVAIDYVVAPHSSKTLLQQTVFNANVGGSLFDIWGGPVAFNVGYEHRKEEASFAPDDFLQQGLGRTTPIAPVAGEFNVDEVFGEILVPIISPSTDSFIHGLEIFGRGRYVDNTVNGGFFSWAAGGSIAPIPDIEFRGNYTRSFRAPAITELFTTASPFFTFVADPCSPANIGLGSAPDIRRRNCNAFLAVFLNATPLFAETTAVPALTGGNPNLENEIAKSFTYGAIIRPRFLPGFTASADYISIKIDQPIGFLGVGNVVVGCFDNPDFDTSDPANGNIFCSQIRRHPAGTIGPLPGGGTGDIGGQVIFDSDNPAVRAGFVNGQRLSFNAIQGALSYRTSLRGLGLPGTLDMSGDMLYVRRRINNITGIAPTRSDGTIGDPEFSGQLNLRYSNEAYGIFTSVNYVGEQLYSRLNRTADAREIDQLDDFATVNASIFFNIEKSFRLTLSVTNLFNRQGESYFGFLNPASINDALGRRFAVNARAQF